MSQFNTIFVALSFNGFDLVSGMISAIKNKEIKSSKLRDGMFKKCGFIMCYILAWMVDTYGQTIGFNLDVSILPVIITYVCMTELVSIIENISKINPTILPQKLLEMFEIKSREDK